MNIVSIASRFPTQEACIAHLEAKRWGTKPACPHCGSVKVARKREGDRIGRWNCHGCKSSFNVLSGTIFERTRVPLPKWFLAIALIVNAKKSMSSYQLARDLDLNQPTAHYIQQRIRAAMTADQGPLLRGIIEADETFLGGRPRKRNRKRDRKTHKRGRGTNKTAILGAVERHGNVKAMVMDNLGAQNILAFLRGAVEPEGSILVTDEYTGYGAVDIMPHIAVNHAEQFSDRSGGHTNTIEGFWSLLKRAWYGSHHHYHWSPLYLGEAAWKYNHRKDGDAFGSFLRGVFAC